MVQVLGCVSPRNISVLSWREVINMRRESRSAVPPPSEPDARISRIRLSGRWSYLQEDGRSEGAAVGKGGKRTA